MILSDLKQAMDDLSPDIIFVLFEKGRGEECVGTTRDIMLRADILLCQACQVVAVIIAAKRRRLTYHEK